MLSENVITTVKETAPVLAEHGTEITRLFYTKLFANHPELQNVFNMANQAQGEQSKALAESIFLYASHIDQLEALTPMVKRIAHKHASLDIKPEQYPIVGKYLLEAIQEYLSLESGDPILTAWAEAYEALADIFIATEEHIYRENENQQAGWRGFKTFYIDKIVDETSEVKSFYLKPKDGHLPHFKPGQYVGVKTKPNHDGYDEIRQYSLSNAPGDDYYRITVKTEQKTEEHPGLVSHHLHQSSLGDSVELLPPTGDFTLHSEQNHKVFIAGGVGITPLFSMLLSELTHGRAENITFIQCANNKDQRILSDELSKLTSKHGFKYYTSYSAGKGGDHEGYLTKDIMKKWLPDSNTSEVYFCGPQTFMSAVNTHLLEMGFDKSNLHYEVFGPTTQLQ